MSAFRARAVRIRSALTILPMVVAVAGCGSDLDGLPTYKAVENRTDEAITIIWLRESGEQTVLVEVPAGKEASVHFSAYGNSKYVCDDGELVALDPSGHAVARSPTNCSPWVIETPERPTGWRDLVA
jgi:hypothetical protein